MDLSLFPVPFASDLMEDQVDILQQISNDLGLGTDLMDDGCGLDSSASTADKLLFDQITASTGHPAGPNLGSDVVPTGDGLTNDGGLSIFNDIICETGELNHLT